MDHCKHCVDETMKLYSSVKRVKELHSPFSWKFTPGVFCNTCYEMVDDEFRQVVYPCDTIKALEGEQ